MSGGRWRLRRDEVLLTLFCAFAVLLVATAVSLAAARLALDVFAWLHA